VKAAEVKLLYSGDSRDDARRDQLFRMRHRILQHAGRRYSLKLDGIVWEVLEELAKKSGLRLNELVARIAQEAGDEGALTAALRLYCLREMRRRLAEQDSAIKELTLTSRGVPTILFAEACPTPCFLVGGDNVILEINEPAERWMSAEGQALVGKNIGHYLQIKTVPPVDEIIRQFGDGVRRVFPARVLHVRPGRLVMARANLCPAIVNGAAELAYFLIVSE
jgi:predicted DNA-binding ribbon-helix-helix protein